MALGEKSGHGAEARLNFEYPLRGAEAPLFYVATDNQEFFRNLWAGVEL
jgi:hypothetical protein